MFFNKKFTEATLNAYDHKATELRQSIFSAQIALYERTQEAIVRTQVVALYPAGPDSTLAQKDADHAKHLMLCAIGTLDGARNDYRNYVALHASKMTEAPWEMSENNPSHRLIENAYKDFFKK